MYLRLEIQLSRESVVPYFNYKTPCTHVRCSQTSSPAVAETLVPFLFFCIKKAEKCQQSAVSTAEHNIHEENKYSQEHKDQHRKCDEHKGKDMKNSGRHQRMNKISTWQEEMSKQTTFSTSLGQTFKADSEHYKQRQHMALQNDYNKHKPNANNQGRFQATQAASSLGLAK